MLRILLVVLVALFAASAVAVASTGGASTVAVAGGGIGPTWSPDGREIAYLGPFIYRVAGSPSSVIVMAFDGTAKHVVVSSREYPLAEVRFARQRLIYNVGSIGVLRSFDPGTGKSRLLGTTDLPANPEEPFAVSRDGTAVAFESPCGCLYQHLPLPGDDIRIASPIGSGVRKLPQPTNASDTQPSFSPDGKQVVLARSLYSRPDRSGAGSRRVMVQSVHGGAARDLGVSGDLPAWSPDGKWIAYERTASPHASLPQYSLAVIPAGGGTPRILVGKLADLDSFSWSPNSQKLVFETTEKIGVVDLQRHITAFTLPHLRPGYSTPQWSPDGTRIAFWATSEQRGSAGYIYVIDADGKQLRRVA